MEFRGSGWKEIRDIRADLYTQVSKSAGEWVYLIGTASYSRTKRSYRVEINIPDKGV